MFEGESASVEVKDNANAAPALPATNRKGQAAGTRTPLLVATLVFALTITFGRDFLYNSFGVPFGVAATAASIAGLLFFLLIWNAFGRRTSARDTRPRGTLANEFKLTAAPDGLHLVAKNLNVHFQWSGILRLNDTDTHMFLYAEGAQAIVVPKHCFGSKEDASRFAIIVRSHIGDHA
jgi:hypothetical protein